MPPSNKTIIVGLSGPSSSGKTTLARLLRSIFNITTKSVHLKLFILHEDDFYKTDVDIPKRTFSSSEFGTRELDDWDCAEALNLPLLKDALGYVKEHGKLPPEMFSKEDKNESGKSGVPDEVVQGYRDEIVDWGKTLRSSTSNVNGEEQGPGTIVLCLLDGFLLYPSPTSPAESLEGQLRGILEPLLDLKLFLPSTREKTIERRTKRMGYVTMEGFWEDPPGYVEDCVWENYARDHSWLFGQVAIGTESVEDSGEVVRRRLDEGEVDREAAATESVLIGPGHGERRMGEVLDWSFGQVREVVERRFEE